MKSKKELLEQGVTSDNNLSKKEKETTINFPNDLDKGNFHSDVATMIKWFLSVEDTEVKDYRTNADGEIIGVRGKIPKSIIKLKGDSRKSHSHSQMVAYGPNKE